MHGHIFDQNHDMIKLVFLHLVFFILLVVAQALTVFVILPATWTDSQNDGCLLTFLDHF
jgi:hypothetical protein